MSRYTGPERRVDQCTFVGAERRRCRRRAFLAVRILAVLCVIAVFAAIAGMFLTLQREVARSIREDDRSALERRVMSCTARGVIELSLARAEQRGTAAAPVRLPDGTVVTTRQLLHAAIDSLRKDCPPLVIPAQP